MRSTVKRQVLYCKANISKSQKSIIRGFLSDCGYGDLTQYFRYSDLPYLMRSLCCHLNDAATPKVILIFDDTESWDRRRISVAYELIKEIAETTGCIASFIPTFKKTLESWSKSISEVQRMLEAVDEWVYLDPPCEAEFNLF